MHCPNDNTTLLMTTRDGIEIDYCPECRGVWLDRGELDKLIDKTNSSRPRDNEYRREEHYDNRDHDNRHYEERRYDNHDKHHYDSHDSHHGHHKKKEGFLGDLFDF